MLLAAYLLHSLSLFVLEAVIEGISACLSSGTGSAYLYASLREGAIICRRQRMRQTFGTAGFLLSTVKLRADLSPL